jgi:hypothetical protein
MNCETLTEYLDCYDPLVADRAREAFEPLHVPATDAAVNHVQIKEEYDGRRALAFCRAPPQINNAKSQQGRP